MSDEIGQFLRGIPPATRFLFLGTLGVTLAGNFGLAPPHLLILSFEGLSKFQIWRLVTPFLFAGQLGFHFVFMLYFLYTYSEKLESGLFDGRRADYIFFLLFSGALLVLIGLGFHMYILGAGLTFSIVYLWAQVNRDMIVTFMFGLRFKAMYLPWVFLCWTLLLGGMPVNEFIGIIVGHTYYFLEHLYPASSGVRLLNTPQFLLNYFPNDRPTVQGFAPTNIPRGPGQQNQGGAGAGGYAWGQGNRLGEN